jgi:hypothetical protein
MKTTRIVAAAVLIVASGLALEVARAQLTGTKRTDLHVSSGNGAELATYVVEKGKPLVVVAE